MKKLSELLKRNQAKERTIWDLDVNGTDQCYIIDSGKDITKDWFCAKYHEDARSIGNAFLTIEEARHEMRRREILATVKKYARPFVYSQENYYLALARTTDTLTIQHQEAIDCGVLYFESKEILEELIEHFGKAELVKYLFN